MTRGLRVALSLLFVLIALRALCYFVVAVMVLPVQIESFHLESKMVLLAYRVQAGLSLYPPWHDYPHVANFFGPVYFGLVGLLGRAFGADIRGLFLIGRAVSVSSAIATSAGLGWYLFHRFGRGAACAGFLISLGSEPTFGYSMMVRPDMLAEMLGVAGFFLVTSMSRYCRETELSKRTRDTQKLVVEEKRGLHDGLFVSGARKRRWRSLGFLLLVAAILTKQTTAIFLVAAALALYLEGERRLAIVVFAGGLMTVALIVAAATAVAEPNMARDFLGESKTPWNVRAWLTLLRRVCILSPDLVVFSVVGILLWNTREQRDLRSIVLAVVVLGSSLVLSGKSGADLNYFISLRVVEALAVATLWSRARSAISRRARLGVLIAACIGSAALAMSLMFTVFRTYVEGYRLSVMTNSIVMAAERTSRKTMRIAENRKVRPLTDSGLVDLHQRERAAFGDPWLFRMLVESGQIQPTKMERWIDEEAYDLVITTKDLADPEYATYDFGLPMVLVTRLRRHYIPLGSDGGFFFYTPRGRGPAGARKQQEQGTR
jgi:hypothetical protein